jgi:hypothetical protein
VRGADGKCLKKFLGGRKTTTTKPGKGCETSTPMVAKAVAAKSVSSSSAGFIFFLFSFFEKSELDHLPVLQWGSIYFNPAKKGGCSNLWRISWSDRLHFPLFQWRTGAHVPSCDISEVPSQMLIFSTPFSWRTKWSG